MLSHASSVSLEQMQIIENARKNETSVKTVFPKEKFIDKTSEFQKINRYTKGLLIPKNVKVSESRFPVSSEQRRILRKELRQAEILARLGNSVYLIPEHGQHGKKLLDALVNGQLFEFKTVTGNSRKIERRFSEAKEKGNDVNVFISIETSIGKNDVRRKIEQVLARHPEYTGKIVVSLPSGKINKANEKIYNVYFWNSDDLR